MKKFFKKLFITLTLITLVAYGGIKFYLYKEVSDSIADANSKFGGAATIEYGSVYSSLLDKAVGLKNVKFKYNLTDDDFFIQKLTVVMPDYKSMISTKQPTSLKDLPQSLALKVEGLEVSLASNIFDQVLPDSIPGSNSSGCSLDEPNWIVQLKSLGHSILNLDTNIGINFNENHDRFKLGVFMAAKDVQTVDMSIEYDISSVASPMAVFGAPKVTELVFEMYDDKLTSSLIEECVTKSGLEKSLIVERQVQDIEKQAKTQFNLPLDDNMKEQFRTYLNKPGRIKISINPTEPVELLAMGHYKPEDVPELLNLSIVSTAN